MTPTSPPRLLASLPPVVPMSSLLDVDWLGLTKFVLLNERLPEWATIMLDNTEGLLASLPPMVPMSSLLDVDWLGLMKFVLLNERLPEWAPHHA
ncbi:hypothetical protein NL676_028732 [Syzygium grande]|nr:hypothetical protein NL676_028732 [Syzygium grande]